MKEEIEQLLEGLKTAQTSNEMAKITIKILRVAGIWNPHSVGLEIARLCVTGGLPT